MRPSLYRQGQRGQRRQARAGEMPQRTSARRHSCRVAPGQARKVNATPGLHITDLKERNVGFKSLRDGAIDTTTASGELVFNIFAALAQFERELIRERTRAGLLAARARGRMGGRKPVSPLDPKVRMAKRMHKDQSLSIDEICSTLRISRATFYRYLSLS